VRVAGHGQILGEGMGAAPKIVRAPQREPSTAPRAVLLVEDEKEQRETLRARLEAFGCGVDAVDSSAAGIELVTRRKYDTVIADALLKQPGTRGEQFLIDIAPLAPDAKKVVITAHGKDQIQFLSELDCYGVVILEKGSDDFLDMLKTIVTAEPADVGSRRQFDGHFFRGRMPSAGAGSDVLELCENLDATLAREIIRPEDVDKRLELTWPLERALAASSLPPQIPGNGNASKIASLLWLKTHPDHTDVEFLLAGLKDENPLVRATAADAVGAVLRVARPDRFDRTFSSQLRRTLEKLQQTESSPLIAFQVAQLLEQLAELARARTFKQRRESPDASSDAVAWSLVNPYVTGSPVHERSTFFGRQEVLNDIERTFRDQAGSKSVLIYGARRTGKTSLLLRIRDGALGEAFLPLYVDMQAMVGAPLSSFCRYLATSLQNALPFLGGLSISVEPADDLASLRNLIQAALGQIAGRRLLFMFDEYELLQDYIHDSDVARQLQSLLEGEQRVLFIFAGADKVEALKERNFMLLVDNSRPMNISRLKLEDARRLITEPVEGRIDFEPGVVNKILELCAGHPFYTQALCQTLFDLVHGRGTVGANQLEQATHTLLENPPPHLLLGWKALSLDQRIAASAAAEIESRAAPLGIEVWIGPAEIDAHLRDNDYPIRLDHTELQQALGRLRASDWLEKKEGETRFRFAMGLVRRWVAEFRSIWDSLDEQRRQVAEQTADSGLRGLGALVDLVFVAVTGAVLIARHWITYGWLPPLTLSYYLVFMLLARMTPGMFFARVRPVTEGGVRLPLGQALFFGALLSCPLLLLTVSLSPFEELAFKTGYVFLGLGLLVQATHISMVHFGKRRRGLFDKLAHVIVVRR
jgi:CheY-like chemotaxis protein